MSPATSQRRRRGRAQLYWFMADMVLPIVNVVLCVLLCAPVGGPDLPFVPVAVVLAALEGAFLWRLSDGAWDRDGRARRLVIGLTVAMVLSFVSAVASGAAFLIACPDTSCFT